MDIDSLPRICIYCSKAANLMCQRCREYYCSVQCQIIDWPNHKRICIPMPSLIPLHKTTVYYNSDKNCCRDMCNVSNLNSRSKASNQQIYINGRHNDSNLIDQSHGNVFGLHFKKYQERDSNDCDNNDTYALDAVDPSNTVVDRKLPYCTSIDTNNNDVNNITSTTINSSINNENGKFSSTVAVTAATPAPETTLRVKNEILPEEDLFYKINLNAVPGLLNDDQKTKINLQTDYIENEDIDDDDVDEHKLSKIFDKNLTELNTNETENWQKNLLLTEQNYFKVIIQYIESNSDLLWIQKSTDIDPCNDMLMYCQNYIKKYDKERRSYIDTIDQNELYLVPFDGLYYRAIILNVENDLNPSEYMVRLIDYGNEFLCNPNDFRMVDQHMRNAHPFAYKIKANQTTPINNLSISSELSIKILSYNTITDIYMVDTIQRNKFNINNSDDSSEKTKIDLKKKKCEIITSKIPENEVCNNFDRSSSTSTLTTKNSYTLNDIFYMVIKDTQNIRMYCLDSSLLDSGNFITASIFDESIVQMQSRQLEEISQYCNDVKVNKNYRPTLHELCFALFDDNQWYRAVCVKLINADNFNLLFIDYGNISKININNIRPFSKEFLYPNVAYKCIFEGIQLNSKVIAYIREYLQRNEIIKIENIIQERDGFCKVHCDALIKYLQESQ